MPSPEDIVAKIKGATPRETYAKQIASLRILWHMIRFSEMDKHHRQVTSKETALLSSYNLWQGKLRNEYSANYEDLSDTAANLPFKRYIYQLQTDELKNYMIENLFSNAAKKRYYEISAYNKQLQIKADNKEAEYIIEQNQRIAEAEKEEDRNRIKTVKRVTGMGLIVIPGLIYIFWAGRRRFNRTNKYGVEEFKSWGDMTFKRLLEEFAGIGVGILILAGIWLLITSIGN
ncbi:MAG: hypothetical protein BGP13_13590 [Sphingobacteriales bacterium 40-81]|nr:MAG: hypothetical protein BGP13_13590 [Sphingobacteriales bacterium 40-81]